MSTENTKGENKVPVLGHLLPFLFSSKTNQMKKTDLVIFITPRIITTEISKKNFRRRKGKNRNRKMKKIFYKGFTIIEFLLAFLIIGIALIGGSAFYFASSKTLVKADITRLATWKAIEKIEKLKATDYASIQNETEDVTIGNIQAQRITTVSENSSPQWKTVTVEVRWTGNSISLSTIILRP